MKEPRRWVRVAGTREMDFCLSVGADDGKVFLCVEQPNIKGVMFALTEDTWEAVLNTIADERQKNEPSWGARLNSVIERLKGCIKC